MKTDYDAWTVGDLLKAIAGERLLLPTYQRRGVWDENKQKQLMASLRKQWPIGSLLFGKPAGDQTNKYLLIDGQQRVTAIREYCRNPCRYLEPRDVSAAVLERLCEFIKTQKGSDLSDKTSLLITEWLGTCTEMTKPGGFSASSLASVLEKKLELKGAIALASACEDVVLDLEANWNLNEREIAIVFYNGPSDDIPEIFKAINTAGEPLDKFDIIAAQWFTEGTDTNIKNPKIVSHIRASYEKQVADGMTFAVPFEDRDPMLVEYLFGLGKWLIAEYPIFFGKPSESNETEEVGFNIAATAHGLAIGWTPMGRLNRLMKTRSINKGKIDPIKFEQALKEACNFTLRALNDILGMRLNRSGLQEPPEILHNTSHLISMICRVLVGQFSADFKAERREWQKEKKVLATTLRHFYLEDILEEKWTGAAATRLFDCVWRREGDKLVPSPHYLELRTDTQWKQMLAAYHGKSKMKRRKTGRYVQKHQKVFLKYAIHGTLLLKQELGEAHEIEHLFPVSRLEEVIEADKAEQSGWAIDHVANLALFSRTLNREKSKQTLEEYCAGMPLAQLRKLKKECLNSDMLMCEISDVAIPRGKGKRFTRGQYEVFLDNRFDRMSAAVMQCLFPD